MRPVTNGDRSNGRKPWELRRSQAQDGKCHGTSSWGPIETDLVAARLRVLGKAAQRYRLILENIEYAEAYVRGHDEAGYMEHQLVRAATERCLQRISEAVSRLGLLADIDAPTIPWGKLRSLGDDLGPSYDQVTDEDVFAIVQNELPKLKSAIVSLLASKYADHQAASDC